MAKVNPKDWLEQRLESILEETRREPGLALARVSKVIKRVFDKTEREHLSSDILK